MKIYAGNLSFDMTEEELREEFASFGTVESVSLPADRYTGRPRGFAFIEMPSTSEGQAAIAALNGKTVQDRILVVNVAKPRSNERSGGAYGSRRSGGFGGGRGKRY
jgi:RNA recognition motif-containing protein